MRWFILIAMVTVSIGCGTIRPMPPQAVIIDGDFVVKQGINIPLGKGTVSEATTVTRTVLEPGVSVGDKVEPGVWAHLGRNWERYLLGVGAVAGDYLTDGEWDAYGLVNRGDGDSSSSHCNYKDRDGELFDIKGKRIDISFHDTSLSDDFTFCINGEDIDFSLVDEEPIPFVFP